MTIEEIENHATSMGYDIIIMIMYTASPNWIKHSQKFAL